MSPVDDEMLMAYLDGELDELGRARVETALAGDIELRGRLETQRRLRERLAAHYGPVAEEPVPDRLRAMLETPIVDLAAARARRTWPAWQSVAAMAATLVLGILLGRALPGDSGPVAVESGTMIAQGSLARALETQLASTQPADAPTRIGVSFARADGRLCRTFESADLAGLACRGEREWQLILTTGASPSSHGAYRQAGSGGAAVMQAAQELMAGEALDADTERRARDRDWSSIPPAEPASEGR